MGVTTMSILDDVRKAIEEARTGGDTYELLLKIQRGVQDLLEENLRLRGEALAGSPAQPQPEVVFDRNAAWKKKPDSVLEGPYCTRCWVKDKSLMPLTKANDAYYRCPECKESFCLYPEKLGGVWSGGRRASADLDRF